MTTVEEYSAIYAAEEKMASRVSRRTVIGLIFLYALSGGAMWAIWRHGMETAAVVTQSGITTIGTSTLTVLVALSAFTIALSFVIAWFARRKLSAVPDQTGAYSSRFFASFGLVARGVRLGLPRDLKPTAVVKSFNALREDGALLRVTLLVNDANEFELWTVAGEKLDPKATPSVHA